MKEANDAGKVAVAKDFIEMKLFIEQVGSNHFLRDMKIELDFVGPYEKVALDNGLKETSTAGAVLEKAGVNETTSYLCGRRDSNPHASRR